MKWVSIYLFGYVLVAAGIIMALWKLGILESLGAFWTSVAALIILGVGVMIAVANSGRKQSIEIDRV